MFENPPEIMPEPNGYLIFQRVSNIPLGSRGFSKLIHPTGFPIREGLSGNDPGDLCLKRS